MESALLNDEFHDRADILAFAQICHHEGARTAHLLGVTLHHLERGADVWRQIDLVDHQEVRARDADLTIYVIDVAAGDKIPSKGGPGITRSDLLVINKIDLAPYVGASLEVMERDAKKMRGLRPFVMTNLREGKDVGAIVKFIVEKGGLNT